MNSRGSCTYKRTSTIYTFLSLIVLRFSFPYSCVRSTRWPSFASGLAINLPHLPLLADPIFVVESSQCEEAGFLYSPNHASPSTRLHVALHKESWGRPPWLSASTRTRCYDTHVHAWRRLDCLCYSLGLLLVLYHQLGLGRTWINIDQPRCLKEWIST